MDAAILPCSRPRALIGAAAASLGVAVILLATSPLAPMVWDEGDAIARAARIPDAWHYAVTREGHPALYGWLIAAGRAAAPRWMSPLAAARLGPILLLAIAAGAMYYRMARQWTLVAAAGAVGALVLMPRLFAHAHFASLDGPLVSCWILAWATMPVSAPLAPSMAPRGRRSDQGGWAAEASGAANQPVSVSWPETIGRILLFALALGMTFSAKATGWLLPIAVAAWAAAYRDRRALGALLLAVPLAVLVFVALNPPIWAQPIGGLLRFWELNLNRGANPGLNISTQFLGRMYNLDHPLPWYNTLFWTAVTVPVGLLALALVGGISAIRFRRDDPAGMLLVANWLVLVVVRALPGTPPHDAERLFLPSFAFLAALAGLGSHCAVQWTGQACRARPARRTVAAAIVLAYLGAATSVVWYAPQWLSYYNLLIGGLRGAERLGMEPTYYWDGLDRETIAWLNTHTAEGEKIAFGTCSRDNLRWLQTWGILRHPTHPDAPGRYRWYVFQRRPSGYLPEDRWLMAHARPVFIKMIRSVGWGPWQLDVPLVEVYDYADYLRAKQRIAGDSASGSRQSDSGLSGAHR